MNNRRFLLPLAVAGSIGIALTPALAEASSTPDPNLAIGIDGYNTSSYGIGLNAGVSGLNAGTVTLTVAWGDGTTSTQTLTETGPSVAEAGFSHTYAALGIYAVSATVTDGAGDTATNSATVATGSEFVPYGPTRILDTRSNLGVSTGAVKAGGTARLQVVGAGSAGNTIPAGITAVALNVTATEGTANGYLTVYGDDDVNNVAVSTPATSNLNYLAGQNVASLVVVPVGADGTVDFYNGASQGSVQLVADVAGYYTASAQSSFVNVSPTRILDTRAGVGTAAAPLPANQGINLTVAGETGIPADATAVAANLTAVDATAGGLITAYPTGEPLPEVSNLNYTAGSATANAAILPIGTGGQVTFHNSGAAPVDLVADVTGYYTKSAVTGADTYFPLRTPVRYIDTRSGQVHGPGGLVGGPLDTLTPYWFPVGVPADVLSTGGVEDGGQPAAVASVVANATVVSPTGSGYLALYPYDPTDPTTPTTSNLNYSTGQTVSNLAIVTPSASKDGPEAAIYLGGQGTAQVILDELGYFGH